jgi:3'(2'), 5'-bisphosphate nucleotidase
MELIELIPKLKEIALRAGAAILEVYERSAEQQQVSLKADKSPLTEADRASNDIICTALEQLPLKYPVISEENKLTPWAERRHWGCCWLVDPLDGTKEFLKRNGDFTINIALIEKGRPVLGLVYVPVYKELSWAVFAKGAYTVRNKRDIPLEAASFSVNDEGLGVVCSRSHLSAETEAFVNRFKNPILLSRGSALKFLMLAKGEAHVYPRMAPTMEWDTAAAQIILEEAGGKVLVFGTEEPLTYNRENLLNPAFIAYGRMQDAQ